MNKKIEELRKPLGNLPVESEREIELREALEEATDLLRRVEGLASNMEMINQHFEYSVSGLWAAELRKIVGN